tara:strand:- start:533 stop:1249 length:717 start_codon:yes stop_codon:yes gene_type:complete
MNLKNFGINVRNFSFISVFREKYHFIHIGKTGGSAIRHNLIKFNSNQNKLYFFYYGHSFKAFELKNNQNYFFCIRNPIQRFVSGFYSRQRMGRPWSNKSKWSHDEEKAFTKFKNINHLAESLYSNDFLLKLDAENAMNSIKHLKDNYNTWFDIKFLEQNKPFFVLETENLDNDFENFCKKLNLKHFNLPKDTITIHKNDYSNTPNLSNLSIINLTKWYKEDISIYNYILCNKSSFNSY